MSLAQIAADEIIKATGNSNIIPLYLDLADLKSVERFVANIQRQKLQVNVLVNNAGALTPELRVIHGVEQTLFVNHM